MKRMWLTFWLIPAVLCPVLLIRGLWAIQQPWGMAYQKIIAMVFFIILWIVSLYFVFQHRFKLTPKEQEKGKWFFLAIANAAFVMGGIFVIVTRPDQWIRGSLGILFFGFCLMFAIFQHRKT